MPWKMVNVDGKRVSLKEAVDEIFSNQDELTNSTYVTLKLDDKGHCRIRSVSDGNREIATNDRYVVMPWKMVTRYGKNMTLKEVVDGIFSQKESKAKERERREREREEIEKKRKEYYETHMKEETERLNTLVGWYKLKLNEIREAPVDDRPRMLRRLYRISEKNKHLGVTITRAGVINSVSYREYPPELEIPEHKSLDCVCQDPCGIHEESPFYDAPTASSLPAGRKPYSQLDNFKKLIKAYNGRDSNAVKYVEKVEAFIDKPLDKLELKDIRAIMNKVKFPRKLDISVFYQLTRRLPHEGLEFKDEDSIIHFYNTFVAASIELLGKIVRCRTNVFFHFLEKTGKEPNAYLFPFMKGSSHQRTEEEIKFVFDHLGWDYSPIKLV